MVSKKSVYECPACKKEVKAGPAKRVVCTECRVEMKEQLKGMITKCILIACLCFALNGCACGPGHVNPMTNTNAHWPFCGWE